MHLRDFRPDVRWIARMLGVGTDDVQVALQHLLRLEFLPMESATCWRDRAGGVIHREEDFTLLALERLAARSRELQLASARNASQGSRAHGSEGSADAAAGAAGRRRHGHPQGSSRHVVRHHDAPERGATAT